MESGKIDYEGMIVIHGTLYEFDKLNERLVVHGQNKIHAYPDILDWSRGFTGGYYDPESLHLYPSDDYYLLNQYEREDYRYFKIPNEIMVDEKRESLTEQQIQQFNEESLKSNHGFYLVDAALSKRLNGELPEMEFDGITYIVDLQNLQISQKEKPEIRFGLTKLDVYYNADFLYNARNKKIFPIDYGILKVPKDHVVIRLSNLREFDPIGVLQVQGRKPTAIVTEMAWRQPKLTVEEIPLHESKIPELISRNQMDKAILKTKQTETQRPQRKKGRRI